MREHEMFVRERDPEHGTGKNRHDRSFHLDRFFCIHDCRSNCGLERLTFSSTRRAGPELSRPTAHDQIVYRRFPANGRGRSSRARASLTVSVRPPTSLPLSAVIAALASALSPMVTNAKPRDLPVMRSIISATSLTLPCCSKRSCRSFSVVSKERFPTYSFIVI